jgi:FkbM family methyltransferase
LCWNLFNWFLGKIVRESVSQTYFGASIRCEMRDFIGRYIYEFGVWEPHISAFLQTRLAAGDVFCDLGANIGYDTLLASWLVGSRGAVVSVEASPGIVEKLSANLALNGSTNVRVVNAAASDRRGVLTITATILASRGQAIECDVPALPLMDILSDRERAGLRLVKIDIEGGELPVLCHILDNIDGFPCSMEIVVEIATDAPAVSGGNSDQIIERFRDRGFRAFVLANSYSPTSYLEFSGPQPPEPLCGPLTDQQDILLSRQYQAD